ETVHIVVRAVPKAEVDPPEIGAAMMPGSSRTETITIANKGAADLSFRISAFADPSLKPAGEVQPLRAGGPDLAGYVFADSDEPDGPVFDWVEIKDNGT
ncbi:MAG TPA: hypothetical protein DCL63_04220, partial [Firmicutes bacterium]|nr:hypothetical protein [Bacillota bacterium]